MSNIIVTKTDFTTIPTPSGTLEISIGVDIDNAFKGKDSNGNVIVFGGGGSSSGTASTDTLQSVVNRGNTSSNSIYIIGTASLTIGSLVNNGGSLQVGSSTLFVVDANGNSNGNTTISTGFQSFGGGLGWAFVASRSTTASISDARGFADQTVFAGSNGIAYAGFDAAQQLFSTTSTNYDHLIGFQARPVFDSAGGSITNMYGFGSFMASKHGTTTNYYDYYAEIMNSGSGVSPTVINRYNFYASGDSRATNNWGIYINGPQNNYLGTGSTVIGTNVINTSVSGGPYYFQSNSDILINSIPFGAGVGAVGGSGNIAIGQFTMRLGGTVSGVNNTAVGTGALASITTGFRNHFVGHNAALLANSASYNSGIGESTLQNLTTGVGNCGIGYFSLYSVDVASYNIAIGYAAGYRSGNFIQGNYNTFLGYGTTFTTNSITQSTAIGANVVIAQSNTVVIGTNTEQVGICGQNAPTAKFHIPAGGTSSGSSPFKITTSGSAILTTPEAGAIETDGTHLYWTDGSGTRHTII